MKALYRASTATAGVAFGALAVGLGVGGDYAASFMFSLLSLWNLVLAR